MICQVRLFRERIEAGEVLNELEKLTIESLLRLNCPEVNKLGKAYNGYCIEEFQRRKIDADPTTNEEDRKSKWRKR